MIRLIVTQTMNGYQACHFNGEVAGEGSTIVEALEDFRKKYSATYGCDPIYDWK